MNGLAVLLAITSFGQIQSGAQFGWELDRDDHLIFIVEIPPAEMAEMEREGFEVAQEIPIYLKSKIDGVQVRIGSSTPPRLPSEEELKRSFNEKAVPRSSGRQASFLQSGNAARLGWEPDREDAKFNFIVKLSGAKNGNNVTQEVPNYVKGKIERIVVQIGVTDPPRLPTADMLMREYESGLAASMASAPIFSPSLATLGDRNRIKQIDYPNPSTPRISTSNPSPNDLAQLSLPNSTQAIRNRDDPTQMVSPNTSSGLGQSSTTSPPHSLNPRAWLDGSSSQGQSTTNNSTTPYQSNTPYQNNTPYQGYPSSSVGFGAGSASMNNNNAVTNQNRYDQSQSNLAYPYNTPSQNGYSGNMGATANANNGYYPERLTSNQQQFEQRPNPYANPPNNGSGYAQDPYGRPQQPLPTQQRWDSNPATRINPSDPYSIPNPNQYAGHLADNSRNAYPNGLGDRLTQSGTYIPTASAVTPMALQYDREGNLLPTTAGSNPISGGSASDLNYLERRGNRFSNDPNSLTRERMLPVFFLMSFVINLYLVVLIYKLLGRYRALLSNARNGSAAPYSQATL